MLDERLIGKKLDVRIQGTQAKLFHNGKFEGQLGFVILDKPLKDVDQSVIVKLGYAQNKRPFPPRYLVPEMTTQRDGFVTQDQAVPVISVLQERVVIIGADLSGNSDAIGNYAQIVYSPWQLLPGQTLVFVTSPGPFIGQQRYYDQRALCRSFVDNPGWGQGGGVPF